MKIKQCKRSEFSSLLLMLNEAAKGSVEVWIQTVDPDGPVLLTGVGSHQRAKRHWSLLPMPTRGGWAWRNRSGCREAHRVHD